MMDVKQIQVSKVRLDKNHRGEYGDLSELMENIKSYGLINPVTVKKAKKGYILVTGHRRLEAIKKLGLKKVDANIINATEDESLFINLSENLQRKNTTPLEHSFIMSELMDRGYCEKEIASRLNTSVSYVKACMRVQKVVPTKYQKKIDLKVGNQAGPGKISLNTMRAIESAAGTHALSKKDKEKLYEEAEKGNVNSYVLNRIACLMGEMSVTEAIKKREDYMTLRFDFVVKKKQILKLQEKYKMSAHSVAGNIIRGDIKERLPVIAGRYVKNLHEQKELDLD